MDVQDLLDVSDITLALHGQPLLRCAFCRDVVSFHKFTEYPQFVETIKVGLAYRIGKLDYKWNLGRQEFRDAQQNITNANHNRSRPPVTPGRMHPPSDSPSPQASGNANQSAMPASNCHHVCEQHHPPPPTVMPRYRPPRYRPCISIGHAHTGHKTCYDHFDDREQGNVLVVMDVSADTDTLEDDQSSIMGTYYELME